jgi:hypothetical protein
MRTGIGPPTKNLSNPRILQRFPANPYRVSLSKNTESLELLIFTGGEKFTPDSENLNLEQQTQQPKKGKNQ